MTMKDVALLFIGVGLFTVAYGAEIGGSGSSSSSRMDVRVVPDTPPLLLRSSHHTDGAAARLLKNNNATTTDPFLKLEIMRNFRAQVEEERNKNRRSDRGATSEKEKAKRVFEKLSRQQPDVGSIKRVSEEEWKDIDAKQKQRGLNWFGDSSSTGNPYSSSTLADPGSYYDKWAQAYRMLGGFIDCDHSKSEDSHDNGNNNNNNNGNNNGACSRWMMWAAYVNPNYQGNEYNEYYGDNPTSALDCHYPDTEWVLLGVYRQEFYQYVEQISKHLWKIDEYEYVVALAGLSYMTKYECFYVGKSSSGTSIYAGVAPQPFGKWQMALYTDAPYCLTPNEDLGMTYDDFGLTSDVKLNGGGGGSQDNNNNNNNGDYDSDVYTWWTDTQEYTLATLNDVYEDFKYCTSCVDYPTYQDGYFIGDYGTDDDDLINQCWKFYSHSSYTCEADCIAMAHAQGSILSIKYGDGVFGKSMNSFYQSRESASGSVLESKFSRLLANAFVTVSFILFVATFLAFAVARRSRYRESRSSKSRRLLDGSASESKRSRSSSGRRTSSSKAAAGSEGDGIFRSSSASRSKSRGKSKSRASSSSRRSRSKSYEAPKEKPRARSPRTNTDYF